MTGVAIILGALLVAWWATATWRPPTERRLLSDVTNCGVNAYVDGVVEQLAASGLMFRDAGESVSHRASGVYRLDALERDPSRQVSAFRTYGKEAVAEEGALVVVAGLVGRSGVVGVTYSVRPDGIPGGLTITCGGEVWFDGHMLVPGLDVPNVEAVSAARVLGLMRSGGSDVPADATSYDVAVVGGELRLRCAVVLEEVKGRHEPEWASVLEHGRSWARSSWDERALRPGQLARKLLRVLWLDGVAVRELAKWMLAEGGEVAAIARSELVQMAKGGASAEGVVLALELVPEAALEVYAGDARPLRALDAWYAQGGRAHGSGFARWAVSLNVSEYDTSEYGEALKTALWVNAYNRDSTRAGLPGMLKGLLLKGGMAEQGVLLGVIAGGPPLVLKEVLKVPVHAWSTPGGGYDVLEAAVRRVGELVSVDGVQAEVDHFLATVLGSTWRVPEASRVVERVIALMGVAGRKESVEVLEHLSREGGLGGASRLAKGALKALRARSFSGALTVSKGEGGELTVSREVGGLTPADE